MNHSPFLVRAALVFILVATATGIGQQPTATLPGPGQIDDFVGPLNMPGDSLDAVLGLVERWTGKTLLRAQNLPAATLSINLKEKVSKKEAIQAIETLLNLNGIALTPLGERFLKVTPLNTAKSEAPEFIEGSALGLTPSGRTAQKLFALQFLRIGEFMPQIAGLLNPAAGSPPVVFDKANAALITDSVSNLQRIETLVARLDQPSLAGLTPKFYPLHAAKASEVVNKLRLVLTGQLQNQLGSATTYSADDRTNQIVLLSDPRQYPFFDELVAKLDAKSDPNTRNEVIQLKHAAAKDVATILTQLVTGQNNAAKTSGQENISRAPQPPGVAISTGQPPAQPPQPAAATPAASALTLEPGTNQFSALLTILPDERSNSLVVSGNVDDIRLIRELVAKIDTLLAQVRIEVVIAEVTLSDTDASGISALNLTVATDATTGKRGITAFDTGDKANGIAGWNITGGVVNPLAFKAALGNTGAKHNVKILSAPTIVTTHNKEAKFAVTQQQPIITGSQALATGATTGFTTSSQVTYKDIGITLKVTPLIGEDGSIQLTIDQIVDDVISNVTVDGNVQPVIGHREANSFVNVNDDQMIVLGGLQRNTHTRDRTKLGFLFEIPILSHLLGGRNNDVERTELLLFVRPHVLRPEEGTADTTQKINELSNKEQINQYLADPTKPSKERLIEKIK
jgi:general secretion pathway protein D